MVTIMMMMTVISLSLEAAVEELRRLLLLLLGCAVQVITHSHDRQGFMKVNSDTQQSYLTSISFIFLLHRCGALLIIQNFGSE